MQAFDPSRARRTQKKQFKSLTTSRKTQIRIRRSWAQSTTWGTLSLPSRCSISFLSFYSPHLHFYYPFSYAFTRNAFAENYFCKLELIDSSIPVWWSQSSLGVLMKIGSIIHSCNHSPRISTLWPRILQFVAKIIEIENFSFVCKRITFTRKRNYWCL